MQINSVEETTVGAAAAQGQHGVALSVRALDKSYGSHAEDESEDHSEF